MLSQVPGLDFGIDPEAVSIYLQMGFIPHPQTIYRGIRKLAPGCRLDFDAGGPSEPTRFYFLSDKPPVAMDYADACEQMRDAIMSTVDRQRVADVPLGAFLSGGLDSSIVVACLAARGGCAVQTFSIGYADHPRYDETGYARLVAERFGTDHRAFSLTFKDIVATVEPMIDHLGEPFADSSLLPTSLVSRYTRDHVTVALSGDGGDELFGGYWRYLGHHYLERYRRLPGLVRRGMIEPLTRLAPSARTTRWLDRLRQLRKLLRGDFDDPMERHLAWARIVEQKTARALIGADRADATAEAMGKCYRQAASAWRAVNASDDRLDEILLAELAISLPSDMLHKVDLASMFHGLEVRVPLLATNVVNLAASLPTEYKLAGTMTKRVLRDAFRDVLPAEVLERRKMGFEVPVGEFLRCELREMYGDVVTAGTLETFGIDATVADRLYEDHCRRRGDYTELLWSLLVLCKWKQANTPAL